jgi:hypothetical protein
MYTLELNHKDVIVSHGDWLAGPQVLSGWTWQAELVRQLIAERDELRARLAAIEAQPTVGWIADSGELIARPEAK